MLRYKLETSAALATDSNETKRLATAGWPTTGRKSVVLVGRQPALSATGALALAGEPALSSLKKDALLWVTHHRRGGAHKPCRAKPELDKKVRTSVPILTTGVEGTGNSETVTFLNARLHSRHIPTHAIPVFSANGASGHR